MSDQSRYTRYYLHDRPHNRHPFPTVSSSLLKKTERVSVAFINRICSTLNHTSVIIKRAKYFHSGFHQVKQLFFCKNVSAHRPPTLPAVPLVQVCWNKERSQALLDGTQPECRCYRTNMLSDNVRLKMTQNDHQFTVVGFK